MEQRVKKTIEESASLSEAFERFLHSLGDWIAECRSDLADVLPIDGHDQATYTVAWNPHILARQDRESLEYLKDLRDQIRAHFEVSGAWKHGYWTMQEAHHGTEHYELFLGNLWQLDPSDQQTVAQMVDVAEHMGNWSAEVPDWFCWEKGLFHSFHFGADGIDEEEREAGSINSPEHFRCVNICLYAYRMTGEDRYLNLSRRFAQRWADALLDKATLLPVLLGDEGVLYSRDDHDDYYAHVEKHPESGLLDNVDRAENFLASGVPRSFLDLWQITGNPAFRRAAEVIIDVVSTQIKDHDAGCGVDVMRRYRDRTGDFKYDDLVVRTVEDLAPYSFQEVAFEPHTRRTTDESTISGHTVGIGKRADKPYWYEDGSEARHNPILLSLAAEIADDRQLALRSLDSARTYFDLAREVYDHGHRHGCGSQSVSAIARGNGRENNSGMVTAVLEPLMRRYYPCWR